MIRRNQFEVTAHEPAHTSRPSVIKPQSSKRFKSQVARLEALAGPSFTGPFESPLGGKTIRSVHAKRRPPTPRLTTAQMRRRRLPPSLDWRTFKSFVPLPTFANRPLKFAFKVMLSCLWSLQAHATRINNHVRLRRRPLCPKMALSTYEEAGERVRRISRPSRVVLRVGSCSAG